MEILLNDACRQFSKQAIRRITITLPVDTGRPDQSLINPITIGLYGSWLVLSTSSWVLFSKRKMSVWITVLLVMAFMLGFFNLVTGASRGPLFGLLLIAAGMAVVGVITLFNKIRKDISTKTTYGSPRQENDQIKLTAKPFRITLSGVVWTIFLAALLTIGIWKIRLMALENFAFLDRIHEMILEQQDGQGNIRQAIWKRAWYQFTVNPIFGDSIINDVGYFYSHNIVMDALMSVGIVGTIPFLVWFFLSFWYFIRLPSERKRQLSVLFVAYLAALLLSMTSGGIFTVPEVWILSAAVIGLSQSEGRREKGEGRIDN